MNLKSELVVSDLFVELVAGGLGFSVLQLADTLLDITGFASHNHI